MTAQLVVLEEEEHPRSARLPICPVGFARRQPVRLSDLFALSDGQVPNDGSQCRQRDALVREDLIERDRASGAQVDNRRVDIVDRVRGTLLIPVELKNDLSGSTVTSGYEALPFQGGGVARRGPELFSRQLYRRVG